VALGAADYGVPNGPETIAVVERKILENPVASISDGTMAFQMQRLSEVGRAAVVVEGQYSALFKLEHVPAAFIADGLARLQLRYPEVTVVFADSRKFAEEWTYRFLAAALSHAGGDDPVAE
jgi:ERCC4-type nuclease